MAANTNEIILTGRLAQDPEVRYTQSGKAVCSMTLAVNRMQEGQADFIPIVAWEKLAEICGNNLTKGRRILIKGRLQIRSYEDNSGQKRRVAEVIAQNIEFLDSAQGQNTQGQGNQGGRSGQGRPNNNPNDPFSQFGGDVFPDEEIPF